MKCEKCGIEFSDKVYRLHAKSCDNMVEEIEELKKEYTVEQLREIAKNKKIKQWWLKSEETLIEELKEVL